MQDNANDAASPVPPTAQRTGARTSVLTNVWTKVRAEATTPTNNGSTMAPSPRTGRKLRVHPLWLAAGTAALFGVIFGVSSIAGVTGIPATTSSAPSGTTIEQMTINVIQTVDPSVVQVQASGNGGSGVGSGEILTTSGYIVTNDHVVRGHTLFIVLLADRRQVRAQLVGEAPTEDLAVLKITARFLRPIAVGDSSKVQVGEYALALGSPLGLEQSATSGIISALNRRASEQVDGRSVTITGLIQTSAPINPGNSGGALVNLKGQLIGIPTLAAVEPSSGVAANGIGFAISSNRMQAIVRQLTGGAA